MSQVEVMSTEEPLSFSAKVKKNHCPLYWYNNVFTFHTSAIVIMLMINQILLLSEAPFLQTFHNLCQWCLCVIYASISGCSCDMILMLQVPAGFIEECNFIFYHSQLLRLCCIQSWNCHKTLTYILFIPHPLLRCRAQKEHSTRILRYAAAY